MDYSTRLTLLHTLCFAETFDDGAKPNISLDDYSAVDSAHYLACFVTFRAIQEAGRQPVDERHNNFDMLSVYQAYAMLIFAFLTLPLTHEAERSSEDAPHLNVAPDFTKAQIIIAKTLFAGIADVELIEIIDSGFHKFKLIGDAEAEHWAEFRESLDKITVSFVVAGTDDDSPHTKDEVLPFFGQLLSQLSETFERD
ncbi:hypothetical protein MCEMSEM29_00853 [Methylophilaceae bacterium]